MTDKDHLIGQLTLTDLAGCMDDLEYQLRRDGGRGGGRGNLVGRLRLRSHREKFNIDIFAQTFSE